MRQCFHVSWATLINCINMFIFAISASLSKPPWHHIFYHLQESLSPVLLLPCVAKGKQNCSQEFFGALWQGGAYTYIASFSRT
uniref:Putative secreted protein n=1 Tax=Ixodes ricinus TaxID=34613 RepID=A0A6B0U881_IXORI